MTPDRSRRLINRAIKTVIFALNAAMAVIRLVSRVGRRRNGGCGWSSRTPRNPAESSRTRKGKPPQVTMGRSNVFDIDTMWMSRFVVLGKIAAVLCSCLVVLSGCYVGLDLYLIVFNFSLSICNLSRLLDVSRSYRRRRKDLIIS